MAYHFFLNIQTSYSKRQSLQCFDTSGWAAERASGLQKTEWWGAGMVICLERGADLHTTQPMPLPLTVSCFSKIQIGFTFLVRAHPGSPGKHACTHTHTRLTALFPGLTRWAATRQITTSAPHHSVFYRPDALPAAQPTVSKHWRDAVPEKRAVKWLCVCVCVLQQKADILSKKTMPVPEETKGR